jgi:hypothetical protein
MSTCRFLPSGVWPVVVMAPSFGDLPPFGVVGVGHVAAVCLTTSGR